MDRWFCRRSIALLVGLGSISISPQAQDGDLHPSSSPRVVFGAGILEFFHGRPETYNQGYLAGIGGLGKIAHCPERLYVATSAASGALVWNLETGEILNGYMAKAAPGFTRWASHTKAPG